MDSVKSKKVKTPGPKTPKSDKKADKSLKKTPIVDTPRPILSAKKQNGIKAAGKPTPNKGKDTPSAKKTPKSEPKKKSKTPVKKVEDDDDDDEEDDDDDSEIELNPEILKNLAEASDDDDDDDDDEDEDMEEDDDDDDDEDMEEDDDDDDDDDDEEDDDDDDDEESLDEEELKKLIQSLKSKSDKKPKGGKKSEEPAAAAAKPKEKETTNKLKDKTSKPESKKESQKPEKKEQKTVSNVEPNKDECKKSMSERDARTLFIKNLPETVEEKDLLKLSSDIQTVRIRKRPRKTSANSICYAFVEFADEATAEKNLPVLSESSIGDHKLTVDYTGQKSKHRSSSSQVIQELDPLKLYITGFLDTTTENELKKLFKKADSVVMPLKRVTQKPLGFAFAKFTSAEVCSEVLKEMNGKMLKESKLIVTFAKLMDRTPKEKGTKRKTEEKKTEGKAKKAKLEKKKEEEEEEDEEDDDDDDDDDDEEDEEEDDEDDDDDDEEDEEDDDDDDDSDDE